MARRSRAALGAVGFGGITHHCISGQAPSRKLWQTRSRRQCWGAWLHHPTFAATHCLTTHSSRRCFATRLNSSVRPQREPSVIFEYTQMDAASTRTMHLLGVPTYAALLASIWAFPYGKPLLGFLAAALGALAYQFLYSKSLYAFVHMLTPPRPIWQFALAVVCLQFLALGVLYAAA